MRSNLFRRASLGSLFLLCLATAGSPTRIAAQDSGTGPADTQDEDGFNEGGLGLMGLAGLLGLKRRDRDEVKRGEVKPERCQPERHQPSLRLDSTSGSGHSGLRTQYIISIPVGVRCKPHS